MDNIERILKKMNLSFLNEMQFAMLRADKKGGDILLLSPTGSGKTLGFVLPLLNRIDKDNHSIQALILVPSRELAIQIEQVIKNLGTGLKINCCYGGHPMREERNNLKTPPHILIGTPGRIADHIRRESFDPTTIHQLIFDEFDKTLELGFLDEVEEIVYELIGIRQRILVSATNMVEEIPPFIRFDKYQTIDFLSKETAPSGLSIKVVEEESEDKLDNLKRLLCSFGNDATLIFCNHRSTIQMVSDYLMNVQIEHGIFHGKMEQEDRELELLKFRNGSHHVLVTTDLASRGLDIPEIKHVIHFQIPHDEQSFIHRNGRTARMHAEGTAYLMLGTKGFIPSYLDQALERISLPAEHVLPQQSQWITLYFNGGRKEKINKTDILGFLIQKGKMTSDQVGKIEIQDHKSFAAVKRDIVIQLLNNIRYEKLKNKSVKIEIAR